MQFRFCALLVLLSLTVNFVAGCDKQPETPAPAAPGSEAPAQTDASSNLAPARQQASIPDPPADPVIVLPETEAPDGGWPLVVMLHGYRSNEADLVPVAQLAAAHNMAAISLPAPFESDTRQYHWKPGEPEHTHSYIQHTVERLTSGRSELFAAQPIWLVGFSQGGLHSVHLAAKYPDAYLGVLAISPAGFTNVPDTMAEPKTRRRFVITGGRAEKARYRASFAETREFIEDQKMPLEVIEHDGGHQFPPNWQQSFGDVFEAWARESSPEQVSAQP